MVSNFISLVLLQGINYLLPLLSFPYLYRVLGVERWGLVSFGYALTQYFILFTDFGFNLSGTKYISENRNNIVSINSYLNSACIGRAILCGISFLILCFLIVTFDKFRIESSFYLLYFGMVLGNVMFPMWFFQGMENMKYITVFNLVAKIISFTPFFIFIKKPEHYIYVPLFYSIGYLIAGFISLYIIYSTLGMKWFVPNFKNIKTSLKDSSTYFLSRLSTSLFTTSNSFLIGLICGNIAVGYYSAAEKLYQAYNQMLTPFTGVLFPHIAKTHDTLFFKKVFSRVFIGNIILLCIAIYYSDLILELVYGNYDISTLQVFQTLLLACFFTIPSMLIGYPFLAAMGHPLFTNLTIILTSAIHITGLSLLILLNLFSIYHVAILIVFTEVTLISFRIFGIYKLKLLKRKR
ncbi:MAG: oligosaccharide flippase family protein [Tannerellaceae bacterium]|nr:oligosaccharide flippase family protein [Tannerellaceae bacterium]